MSIAEKLTTIAENEQRVFEAGKTAEWNYMWDIMQDCGNKTSYKNFCYRNIFIVDKDTTPRFYMYPKYDFYPTSAEWMFREFNATTSGAKAYSNITIDFTQWLADLGVKLDMSRCTNASCMFYNNQGFSRVPFLDLSVCTNLSNFMAYTNLKTIDGIKSSETTAWTSTTFGDACQSLTHCPFSGVIAKNLNLSKTNLDYESLMSVLSTLKNLSGTGTALTLTLNATLIARLEATEEGRQALTYARDTKGWTIVG